MTNPADVVTFWLTAGPEKWYVQDAAFDQAIRDQFGEVWHAADSGQMPDWAQDASGALALVILLDQFPRNMFREDSRAFATDAKALEVTEDCLSKGWDLEIAEPERQFIYMPFMHSEDMAHQNRGVELMDTRMTTGNNALHARAHREIIARFGRFPYRNAALGRDMTPEEQVFIDGGGYRAIFQALEEAS
ncbi:DUF924 family protein [Gymnodinialimonas sp.]